MAKYIERIFGQLEEIDRAAAPAQQALDRFFKKVPFVRDALSGALIGRPIHPLANTVPLGAWTSTLALDIYSAMGGGRKARRSADASLAVGLLAAGRAVLTGLADFSATEGVARRVGFVHGAANMAVIGLYGASFIARSQRQRALGVALSSTGYGLMLGTALLGSAMVYDLGVGVNVRPSAPAKEAKPEEKEAKPESITGVAGKNGGPKSARENGEKQQPRP